MPKVTSTKHTWTVEVAREAADTWPDLQISATLWITPDTVTIEYKREAGRWEFKVAKIRGDCYRPLKNGERKPRGRQGVTYWDGAPEEYHPLILAQRAEAEGRYLR